MYNVKSMGSDENAPLHALCIVTSEHSIIYRIYVNFCVTTPMDKNRECYIAQIRQKRKLSLMTEKYWHAMLRMETLKERLSNILVDHSSVQPVIRKSLSIRSSDVILSSKTSHWHYCPCRVFIAGYMQN
uniref:Uncharacterized protein n=1 Tax=Romanomermis culicivorax TaxID=13658 RepID=A0A915J9Y9_ROMCU